jgi:flagellar protein FliO/FliZ
MPHRSRRRRAMRAGVAFAVVLALGFAADALVLVSTRARAQGASAPTTPELPRRSVFAGSLSRAARPGGSDAWAMAMVGITLVLAVCGGIIAAMNKLRPQRAGAGMQVVGRVGLSPKHAVYMLRVGRRTLLVGVGPQGAPSLISELEELAEIETDAPQGEPK